MKVNNKIIDNAIIYLSFANFLYFKIEKILEYEMILLLVTRKVVNFGR